MGVLSSYGPINYKSGIKNQKPGNQKPDFVGSKMLEITEKTTFWHILRFSNELGPNIQTYQYRENARFEEFGIPTENAQDRILKKCFKNFLDRFFRKIDENLIFFEKMIFLIPENLVSWFLVFHSRFVISGTVAA